MSLPRFVKIVEVGPRDGLQNEPQPVPTSVKYDLIQKLGEAGLKTIEATSFVSPKRVPQMADHTELLQQLSSSQNIAYPVLVPNLRGLENALSAGAKSIAVFTAASDIFNQKNIQCSTEESLERLLPVIKQARERGLPVRGYVSCVLGCPYSGAVPLASVQDLCDRLYEAGCEEIALGDTIGRGTAGEIPALLEAVTQVVPLAQLALHCHNTYGQALTNILVALQHGLSSIDASVAGLGGCPYAPGASGNVATEDVVYLLHGLGIETGIDLDALCAAGDFICDHLGQRSRSSVALARANAAKVLDQ